jgi:hypothetical protein
MAVNRGFREGAHAPSDMSPINYLILIGEIDILPKMYGSVVVPPTVREELVRLSAPQLVRSWIDHCQFGSSFGAHLLRQTHRWESSMQGERDATMTNPRYR